MTDDRHGASCTCDACMDRDERQWTVWHDDEDEIRDYLEQHTLWGASVRFERAVHELSAELKKTAPIRLCLAVIEFVLRHVERLLTQLAHWFTNQH